MCIVSNQKEKSIGTLLQSFVWSIQIVELAQMVTFHWCQFVCIFRYPLVNTKYSHIKGTFVRGIDVWSIKHPGKLWVSFQFFDLY